jgi:hypothetical protein
MTDIWEERGACNFRVEDPSHPTSQRRVIFIIIAMRTSNLILHLDRFVRKVIGRDARREIDNTAENKSEEKGSGMRK